MLFELDHEGGALVPVGRHLGRKVAPVQHSFDDPGGESGAVQRPLVLRHRDELVHQRLFLDDVVGLLVVVGVLKLVGLLPEERLPHGRLDHQENVEKLGLSAAGLIANDHEVEDASPDLPTELVKLLLELRNGGAPALAVLDEL